MDVEGYHPNVSGDRIRSKERALSYVSKECPRDQLLQFNMDIAAECDARQSHKKIIGKRLLDGADLVGEVEDNPALLFGYKRLKMDIEAYNFDKARQ